MRGTWSFIAGAAVASLLIVSRTQACNGQHLSTAGSGAGDTACVFNVDVHADNFASGYDTGQQFADQIASAMTGTGAPSEVDVTWMGAEGNVTFSIPAGVQEVTITVEDTGANGPNAVVDANGWYWTPGGNTGSTTEVLVNGHFETQAAAGGADPCAAPPPPPPPPLNAAIPGPGLDPDDNKAAVNDLQGANVPIGKNDADDKANRTGKVE